MEKSMEIDGGLVITREQGEKGMEKTCLMGVKFYFRVMKVFCNQREVVIEQHCE